MGAAYEQWPKQTAYSSQIPQSPWSVQCGALCWWHTSAELDLTVFCAAPLLPLSICSTLALSSGQAAASELIVAYSGMLCSDRHLP